MRGGFDRGGWVAAHADEDSWPWLLAWFERMIRTLREAGLISVRHGVGSVVQPRSTVLTIDEEAVVVAFRRHTLLPLASQPSFGAVKQTDWGGAGAASAPTVARAGRWDGRRR